MSTILPDCNYDGLIDAASGRRDVARHLEPQLVAPALAVAGVSDGPQCEHSSAHARASVVAPENACESDQSIVGRGVGLRVRKADPPCQRRDVHYTISGWRASSERWSSKTSSQTI
jgi:hypothetical protein